MHRQWRPWLISLAVTAGLYWWLLAQVDMREVVQTARSMSPRYLGAFVILLVAGVGARAVRFWLLLGRAAPLQLLTPIVMVRNLFVDLLPARIGELSYVYLLSTRAGLPAAHGLASLFLSVLFDLVALAPLLLVAAMAVGSAGTLPLPILGAAAILLGGIAYGTMRVAAPVGEWIASWLPAAGPAVAPTGPESIHATWRARTADLMGKTVTALREVERRRIFGRVMLVSLVVRLCKFGSYYFLVLASMEPLGYSVGDVGFFRVFLGIVSAELAAALPVHGIAGFGTFEAAWALSFSQLGFSVEDATTTGILTHFVSQLVEYSLGGLALLYILRWRGPHPTRVDHSP